MRKRFTKDECSALELGAAVEWRNGRHWRPGSVVSTVETDSLGMPYVWVAVAGERVRGYPTYVRAAG